MEEKKFEKSFFEEWSKDYDKRRNKSFLEKSKQHMTSIIDRHIGDNSDFLEIGLGTGEVFELLSSRFKFSCGTDISEGMVRRTYSKEKVKKELFVGDACNLPLKSNSFDFVVCQDVLEHVPYQEKLILEICRVLKKDGVGIITTPNPLWAPILYFAEKLGLKVKEGEHKFIFLPSMVKKSLKKSSCVVINTRSFMMIPLKSNLDRFFESLSNKKNFSKLGFSQMCVIKKLNHHE